MGGYSTVLGQYRRKLAPHIPLRSGYPAKLTSDVKLREQRGENNKEKNNNSCTTKKNITGFYTEDESYVRYARVQLHRRVRNSVRYLINPPGKRSFGSF